MLNEQTVDSGQHQQIVPEASPQESQQPGYFNGSYTMGVDDPQTLEDNAAASSGNKVSSEELASIAAKLGVDVDALSGLLGVESSEPNKEQPEEDTSGEDEDLPEDDKKIKERLLHIDKEVQELLGVGLTEVYGLLQELQAFKAQYVVEQQTNILKSEWGDNYQETLQEVKGYWEKLPEAQKKALDNVEGARLIHALITKDKAHQPSSQYVRQGSVKARSGATPKFRMSDVVKLSEADYIRIQPQLEEAFRRGQVVNDIR